ncbi:hypothetical protein D4L85_20420 [Chryseolinea soli]|uniref:Uncharacterized protein n=1 Tax=Chryseolinea soli TaxID=2321403 RepID=A0A385SRG4_9BACT|nr:hypothetical protein D4L85_20420 [Chryseolinea soli]
MVSLLPGLVLNGKESIHRSSQNPVPLITSPRPEPSKPLPIHKDKKPAVWIFIPDVKDKRIEVFGYGEDEEEGSMPNQWYCWEIELHHRKKIIQTKMVQGTKSFTLEISRKEQLRHQDWYRVRLSISDASGGIGKDSVDLYLNR